MAVPVELVDALSAMPDRFEQVFRSIPAGYATFRPASWEGVPGETFSALEHACHLRDIEIDGYQIRLRRTVEESQPFLESIDGYALAEKRRYASADADEVLAAFRSARKATVEQVRRIGDHQPGRTARFEGYGEVTLQGLVHLLCSHDLQHLACMEWLLARIGAAPR